MKTVGKQLQDARTAKGWSPELAARETKIRVDRLHDLESDDYSNFSSPTYARGFVRTYARALGLDEYKILRQLDNKLPEDDNASFANDAGVPYMPEPSQVAKPFEVGRGVYIAGGVGTAVLLLIGFILIQSYRAGYFAAAPAAIPAIPATNALPIAPETETARALPADSNAAPVPIPVDTQAVAATPASPVAAPASSAPPRALPVNLSDLSAPAASPAPVATTPAVSPAPAAAATPTAVPASPVTTAAPATTTTAAIAAPIAPVPDAAPVVATTPASATANASTPAPAASPATANAPAAPVTSTAPATTVPTTTTTTTTTPPRALPVDLGTVSPAPAADATPVDAQPHAAHSLSARDSNAHSEVDVAAAKAATDSLIASTAPAPNAPPPTTSVLASRGPVVQDIPVVSTPTDAPSSLAPASMPAPEAAAAAPPDSTAALTGTPATSEATPAPAVAPSNSPGSYHGQRLVLTASHDSFVRVIALDGPNAGQVRYSSTLRGGESISFNDRKYSINVGNPSAVDIALDGINYGPHSDNSEPDTFTVESHTP